MVSCLSTLSIRRSKHTMHWMLCLSRLSILLSKHIHTFLPITFLIFNLFSICKKFWKAETEGFSTIPSILYICRYSQYKTRISNAFNAIYFNTVDTKHIHTFLPITFLIFNQFSIRKKFWKAETEGFSTIPSILYMLILSIQDKDLLTKLPPRTGEQLNPQDGRLFK